MSWLYSRALVVEYLGENFSDGGQSAPLNGSHTPQAYLPSDKTTAFSRLSRFGMTFAPLTADRGAELLTLWLEGFHAKTSALPEKAQESAEKDQECGRTWRGSLAKFDPVSSSWKTAQHSLLEDLEGCSVIWPRSGSMRNGECWERLTLEPRTSATGFGLWPTPLAQDAKHSGYAKSGPGMADKLSYAVVRWPTPQSQDAKHSGKNTQARIDQGRQLQLAHTAGNGGSLNPMWVEWLMGWPLGWTDLKPLATDKSHSAPLKHSNKLQPDLSEAA